MLTSCVKIQQSLSREDSKFPIILNICGFVPPLALSPSPIRHLNVTFGQARERGRELMQLSTKELH